MISVLMKPGQIALTRMPCAPYSTAPAFVMAMTPAFAAEYTVVNGEALSPPIDDQLTIAPPLPRFEHGADPVLHAEEHAAQVDVHRPVVVLHGHVGQHHALGDAGDVQHGVEATELLDRGAHHRLDVGFLA